MTHPDDDRYCNPCGWLFATVRDLRHHRIRVHKVAPPCRQMPKTHWCDYDHDQERVHHGGFMGHTCVR